MSRFSSFLFGAVTGAGLLYAAMSYHLIRSGEGFHLVAKQSARLGETYIDVRSFTVADWAAHPRVAATLIEADKQHLIGDSAAGAIERELPQLLPKPPKK